MRSKATHCDREMISLLVKPWNGIQRFGRNEEELVVLKMCRILPVKTRWRMSSIARKNSFNVGHYFEFQIQIQNFSYFERILYSGGHESFEGGLSDTSIVNDFLPQQVVEISEKISTCEGKVWQIWRMNFVVQLAKLLKDTLFQVWANVNSYNGYICWSFWYI